MISALSPSAWLIFDCIDPSDSRICTLERFSSLKHSRRAMHSCHRCSILLHSHPMLCTDKFCIHGQKSFLHRLEPLVRRCLCTTVFCHGYAKCHSSLTAHPTCMEGYQSLELNASPPPVRCNIRDMCQQRYTEPYLSTLPPLCFCLQLHGCPHICWRVDVSDLISHALQAPVRRCLPTR